MKKRLVLLITLALILVVACIMIFVIFKHEHIQDEEWSFDAQMHYKNVHCTWNICMISVISYEHVDEDEDRICDICFYRALEHEHTFKYVQYETGHFKQYTCGCPSPDIMGEHYDTDEDCYCDVCGFFAGDEIEWQYSETHHWWCPIFVEGADAPGVVYGYGEHINNDADLFCDVCGFNMSGIPTPTNHFLRNQAGCEWLNEISAEDIAEIKIICEAVGVAPGVPKNISSSTDETVIARIFEEYYWLDTSPISKGEGEIDGGGAVTVKFILNDETVKEIYINNGNYLDTDGNYFELIDIPKFEEGDNVTKAYGFISYMGTGTVYDKENNPVCEIPIDEIEFVITGLGFGLFDDGYDYYVDTEFGKLYFVGIVIMTEHHVSVDWYLMYEYDTEYSYRLVGKKLDELIADYTIVNE